MLPDGQPWESDGYSPLDFSLLDPHFGAVQDWRDLVTEVHRRGMYVIVDFTVTTMSDMVGRLHHDMDFDERHQSSAHPIEG